MLSILSYVVTFSIWVSLAAASCPLLVDAVYDIPVEPWKPVVAFLCAFFVYSWDKVSSSTEDLLNTPERAILVKYPIRDAALVAYAIAIILVLWLDWTKWYCVAIFGAAGFLYTIRVKGYRLKDIPGLKGPYVAAVWAIAFAGLVGAGYSLIFLLILINTVLFDMRDLIGDAAEMVPTIPVMLGASRTSWILVCLDALLFLFHPGTALVGIILIWYFSRKRASLQYDLLVDGWPMISLVLIHLFDVEMLI